MGLISVPGITDGTVIDAGDVNTPINTIVNEINGNIDSNNILNGSVGTAELADNAVTTTKIADANVTVAKIYNPYKFYAYRTAAFTTGNNVEALTLFDTIAFDTNNNFNTSTGEYTVPVTGYYQINARVGHDTMTGVGTIVSLYKNGSLFIRGRAGVEGSGYTGTFETGNTLSTLCYVTAGDKLTIYNYNNARPGHTGFAVTYFNGYLVSV